MPARELREHCKFGGADDYCFFLELVWCACGLITLGADHREFYFEASSVWCKIDPQK